MFHNQLCFVVLCFVTFVFSDEEEVGRPRLAGHPVVAGGALYVKRLEFI